MKDEDAMKVGAGAYERHLQSVVVGFILLLLGWIASGVHDNGTAITSLQKDVAVLQAKLIITADGNYHENQAAAAHKNLQLQIDALKESLH